jgi:hypothetical protein
MPLRTAKDAAPIAAMPISLVEMRNMVTLPKRGRENPALVQTDR